MSMHLAQIAIWLGGFTSLVAWGFRLPQSLDVRLLQPSPATAAVSLHLEFKPALSKLQERTVFVFLSAECPCSDSYIPELNRLAHKYAEQGVRFVGVHSNADESREDAQKYFSKAKVVFPVVDDGDQKILNLFAALKTPHVFVIDHVQRTVIYHGGVGSAHRAEAEMNHLLERALDQGLSPDPKETKTLGCLIARQKG